MPCPNEFTFNVQITIHTIAEDAHDVRLDCYGEITDAQRELADEVMRRFSASLREQCLPHSPPSLN